MSSRVPRSEVGYYFPGEPLTFIAIYFKMASSQENNLYPVDIIRVLTIPEVCDLLYALVNDNDLRGLNSLIVISRQSVALLQHRTWTIYDESGNPAFQITHL